MTFAAARVAMGGISRRKLEFGGALPVMESFAETGGGNSLTRTVTAPSGIVEDDVLICHVGIDGDAGAVVLTPPTDTTPWVELTQGEVPNGQHASGLWYKVVTAVAEPASYLWTTTFAEVWGISVARFSGVDPVNPITNGGAGFSVSRRDTAIGGNTDDKAPLESILCTRTNCLLYHALSANNQDLLDGITASSANGEVNLFAHLHGGSAGTWHGTSHEDFALGGGTGQRIWTFQDNFPGDAERATHLIGLQPPIVAPSFLQLEGSLDRILLEDGSGVLILEN